MVVQLIQGGSGNLRTEYPSLINLLSAFFFPVGLIMLVITGQDLCTANFSKSTRILGNQTESLSISARRYDLFETKDKVVGITCQLDNCLFREPGWCTVIFGFPR
jgi:hypothetical protein